MDEKIQQLDLELKTLKDLKQQMVHKTIVFNPGMLLEDDNQEEKQ